MLEITTKPLQIDLELKKKIEFICDFCNTTPAFKNGSIRNVDLTNISYIEPHRIIIKGITLLAFNYSSELYVESLDKKIEIKDLESFIKTIK